MLLFLAAFAYTIYGQREIFFQMTPLEVCRSIYGANPFPEALDVARLVRSQTPKGTPFAIVGSEPEIFFYADRLSATGYIYTYELMEPQKYAAIMQNEMIAEIEKTRPELLIYVDVPSPGFRRKMPTCTSSTGSGATSPELPLTRGGQEQPESDEQRRQGQHFPPLSTWNIYVYKKKQLATSNCG